MHTALLRRCELRAASAKCWRGQNFRMCGNPLEKFLATPLHPVLAAHAELAANGVVHCLPGEVPEIYCTDEEQESKDRLLTVHTSADSGNF